MSTTAETIRNGHADDGTFRVYTTTYCGFCVAAKRLLAQQGLPFTEVDIGGYTGLVAYLSRRDGA